MHPSIEHLGVIAKDTEKMAQWYESVLGFSIIYRNKKTPPTFFVKDIRGLLIEIFPGSGEVATSSKEN